MGRRTALFERHLAWGAKIVGFAGWEMPLHYGSQVAEHHKVRQGAGMFDVSHMTVVDVRGRDARPYFRHLLANNVDRLPAINKTRLGKALYTCLLNERGGIIDDLLVYFHGDDHYRLVMNAATRKKDLAWLETHAGKFNVGINERLDLAMIAIQGPRAREPVLGLLSPALRATAQGLPPFHATWEDETFVSRTGYTGEDGFEVLLPNDKADAFVQGLYVAGVAPVGLGARDTLRLEAGLNLYGTDMDESITPLECGLAWTVAWTPPDRDFIGREALESQERRGVTRRQVGLVLENKGVLRRSHRLFTLDGGEGEVTSGSFSPTLARAIALARVPAEHKADVGDLVEVEIRGTRVPACVVKPPFVRHGKPCVHVGA